ncbi:hypothetical protein UlMin_002965 [Ulmus minor]
MALVAKPKLILICQYLGKFDTNDDGTLSYTGGQANAIDITPETVFDELKLKLAEMCDFASDSLSIKYFLPGNKRTLINLTNDKDLKRMYDFHGNSVTADIFVTGNAGFVRKPVNVKKRASGIKIAEKVTPIAAPYVTRRSATPSTDGLSAASATPTGTDADTDSDEKLYDVPTIDATTIDLDATPADTVKKRRRSATQKRVAKRTDNVRGKRKSRRKNILVEYDDDDEEEDNSSNDSGQAITPSDLPPDQLVALWKNGITGVGQEFKSVYEFRDALQKYAIANRFMYRLKKNDTNRASGRCVIEDCSWKIYASWDSSSQLFTIKSMVKSHTCGGKSWKFAHPAKNWLVNIIKDRLQNSPHHKPKELAKSILQDFGVEVNYTQVWRGIGNAREQLQGSYKEAYNQLPWLCEKMTEANPGSLIKLFTGDDKRFQRLFVSFHASIDGFQKGCRPILFLEATSLKSKFHEILLTATALDGDDGLFPVAFAIVDTENSDSWRWFLEQLKSAVSATRPITFVSDREKGLKDTVLEVFENAHHGYSIFHLMESLKRNLKGPFHGDGKGSLPIVLVFAAQAVRHDAFRMYTEQIKRVSAEAYNWVMQIEPEYWTSISFKGEPYNHVSANVAEPYTQWMQEVRETPIIQKIETLTYKMLGLMDSHREDSRLWTARLAPSMEEKLLQQASKAHGLKVLISSEMLFEVHDDLIHVVDIGKRECSCQRWKQTGLPCCHAIAVFRNAGKNVYDYCSQYFTADSFRLAYSGRINAVEEKYKPSTDEKTDSEDVQEVLPPLVSRPPPSEKKEKEPKPEGSKVRKPRVVTCAKCKGTGHYKATCKAIIEL